MGKSPPPPPPFNFLPVPPLLNALTVAAFLFEGNELPLKGEGKVCGRQALFRISRFPLPPPLSCDACHTTAPQQGNKSLMQSAQAGSVFLIFFLTAGPKHLLLLSRVITLLLVHCSSEPGASRGYSRVKERKRCSRKGGVGLRHKNSSRNTDLNFPFWQAVKLEAIIFSFPAPHQIESSEKSGRYFFKTA